VWTTTPWTLAANVAAAVGEDIEYVRIRQGELTSWVGRGRLKQAVVGPFEVLESKPGRDLVGWRYTGPFDELPVVVEAFAKGTRDDPGVPYAHRVIPWTEVGEDEGTGIVHIAPGAGAEDYQLGKSLGLPVIGPIDEDGRYYASGFGWLSGKLAPEVAEEIVDDLEQQGFFYHLEPYTHRYPHCWRCNTPLLFRLVDEWFISMGEVYDQPRDSLTKEQVDASLRYQIMEVVDQIRWIPGFGYERELDWLMNMHDWMISKKRYWGLALPIYDCQACGDFDVVGGRAELKDRAIEGWATFEGHTPHRPWVDAVKIACSSCGAPASRILDVGNPWLDAGIVPFSTLHFREDPGEWAKWFPADFITESFPGQFRNWFYSMLAMSTVLRREPPFKEIFGYALVFGEDGRPMHKSWGNAIEFDEAADRMGVDVMRWMFARARPEENILFGWHAADEARRGQGAGTRAGTRDGPRHDPGHAARSLDPVAGRRPGGRGGRAPGRHRSSRRHAPHRDLHRRPLHVVPAPLPEALLPEPGRPRSRRRVRNAAHGPDRPRAGDGARAAVPDRSHVPQPRRRGGTRFRPPHPLAGGAPGGRS